MKKASLLIALAGVLVSCSPYANIHKSYVKEHSINLTNGLNKAFEDYEHGFDNYEVFLLGENHGIKDTFEIDFEFTKYLYQTQGVRNILLEIGFSDAKLLNNYLETGNEELLNMIVKNYVGTFAFSNDNYEMYTKLFEFNYNLPENEKIHFFGIDIQHQVHTGMYYLNSLQPNTEIPESIKTAFEDLKKCSSPSTEWKDIADNIKLCIENYNDIVRLFLSDNYDDFVRAFDGIYQKIDTSFNVSNPDVFREEKITSNFYMQSDIAVEGKFIGFMGGAHVGLNSEGVSFKSFAERINTSGSYAGKVASFSIVYPNGKHMNKGGDGISNVKSNSLTKLFKDNVEFDYAFCRLTFEETPFKDIYSQYVISIKNATAASKFNK